MIPPSLLAKNVVAFSKITGTRIALVYDEVAWTDGTTIGLPWADDSILSLEIAIAHIMFRTRLSSLVSRTRTCALRDTELRPHADMLRDLVIVLERHRVLTLWGSRYEGSARQIREAERIRYAQSNRSNLVLQVRAASLGVENTSISCLDESIDRFLREVERGAPSTSVQAAISLLHEATKELHAERIPGWMLEPSKQADGSLVQLRETSGRILADDTERASAENLEEAASCFSECEEEETPGSATGTASQNAIRGVQAEIFFRDIPSDPRRQPDLRSQKIRTLFRQLRTKTTQELQRRGRSLDVSAVVRSRGSWRAREVLRSSTLKTGFELIVLADLSSSMNAENRVQIEQACSILVGSLDAPVFKISLWGFKGDGHGRVHILRFSRKAMHPARQEISKGTTPLHLAIRVAVDHLRSSGFSKHLLVLTDGLPTFFDGSGFATREVLIEKCKQEIDRSRRHGVSVVGGVIRELTPSPAGGRAAASSQESTARKIFGKEGQWAFLDQTYLRESVVSLATQTLYRSMTRGG